MRLVSRTLLFALTLTSGLLSFAEVHARPLVLGREPIGLQAQALPLFTYHGSIEAGGNATQVPILLHVLVKAKRRANGSIAVRTVSYPENVDVSKKGDFAPTAKPIDLFLEHRDSQNELQLLPFSMHGLMIGSGPVVHELTVPRALASETLRLRVNDWPIYYTLSLSDLLSQNTYGPTLKTSGVFQNAVVIGDMHHLNVTVAAQLLATHMTQHFALGFDLYIVYTRGPGIIKALQENPVTARHISAGSLQTVSLDSLGIPLYDRQTRTVYDASKIIAYNHADLMLWGDRFHLTVIDIDEMWSSKNASVSVNQWFDKCYPGSDIISATRVEMTCSTCARQELTEMEYFAQHWNAADPTSVLRGFSKVVNFHPDPKSIFDVDRVGQVWLHSPFILSNSRSATVTVSDKQFDLAQDCIFVVHLPNLFSQRIADANLPDNRQHYLVHRHRTSSTVHRGDDPISI